MRALAVRCVGCVEPDSEWSPTGTCAHSTDASRNHRRRKGLEPLRRLSGTTGPRCLSAIRVAVPCTEVTNSSPGWNRSGGPCTHGAPGSRVLSERTGAHAHGPYRSGGPRTRSRSAGTLRRQPCLPPLVALRFKLLLASTTVQHTLLWCQSRGRIRRASAAGLPAVIERASGTCHHDRGAVRAMTAVWADAQHAAAWAASCRVVVETGVDRSRRTLAQFGQPVTVEMLSAVHRDGVLSITVPKSATVEPEGRQVAIGKG